MNSISNQMKKHYQATFDLYGPCSSGVDWGSDDSRARIRHQVMSDIIPTNINATAPFSILDIGCGFGAFVDELKQRDSNASFQYFGIDIVESMVSEAKKRHPQHQFFNDDFLVWDPPCQFDYVTCNGVLTQKLQATDEEMREYSEQILLKMFALARHGIAFNCMTTNVNYRKSNIYYRNPIDFMQWTLANLSDRVKLNSAYGIRYEYTIFVYHD